MAEIVGASIVTSKSVDKAMAYVDDTVKYSISLNNVGNTAAENVVITDQIPVGTTLVENTLKVNVASRGDLTTGITLDNPIEPKQIVVITFEVTVSEIPNPNPINNKASVKYSYTDTLTSDVVDPTSISNSVLTFVPKYKLGQQITDIIESIALEEAALAAIITAESAKIDAIVEMDGVSQQELLCLNKSVSDTLDSITLLESILKQKLNILSCQVNPHSM